MVHYKLTYFNGKGVAEPIRQLFALAGVEFEDHRINWGTDEWPTLKPKTLFGTMPVLEVDGKQLGQSIAIARYIGKKYGFAGKDDWEQAQVDAVADQYKDFQNEVRPFIYSFYGLAPGDTEQLKKDVFDPAIEKHLAIFSKVLKNSGNGFLVGNSVTFVDICLAEILSFYASENFINLENFPELKSLEKKVHGIPAIAKWIETRPETVKIDLKK